SPNMVLIGVITLMTMITVNIFVKGQLKLYAALVGMLVGYILAFILGEISSAQINQLTQSQLFAIPYIRNMSWAFDFSLIIPFTVAMICSTLKTVGDLVTCQKINNANWKRPDMKNIGKGIFADGIGGLLPGLIGGYGQSTSSSNIGLSLATGITSRVVAFAAGGFLIILAFLPKVAFVFLMMPRPVMGASLIFAVSFMIIAGIQIITSRMLDARKIFVVGVSFIFGLSVDIIPGVYNNVHPWIKPIFASSLSLSMITAIILNFLLRLGIAKKQSIDLKVERETNHKLIHFMDANGKSWGALQEVIQKSKNALCEFNEALLLTGLKGENVHYEAIFDELNINVEITYRGEPMAKAKVRPEDWLKAEDKDFTFFAMTLINNMTDKMTVHQKEGLTTYRLHFVH
ncbi:xanthine permease, partial [candidate division KSB1 bacterium]|nr:xanthine permease [candidate division KSB1 bacterium]